MGVGLDLRDGVVEVVDPRQDQGARDHCRGQVEEGHLLAFRGVEIREEVEGVLLVDSYVAVGHDEEDGEVVDLACDEVEEGSDKMEEGGEVCASEEVGVDDCGCPFRVLEGRKYGFRALLYHALVHGMEVLASVAS